MCKFEPMEDHIKTYVEDVYLDLETADSMIESMRDQMDQFESLVANIHSRLVI